MKVQMKASLILRKRNFEWRQDSSAKRYTGINFHPKGNWYQKVRLRLSTLNVMTYYKNAWDTDVLENLWQGTELWPVASNFLMIN